MSILSPSPALDNVSVSLVINHVVPMRADMTTEKGGSGRAARGLWVASNVTRAAPPSLCELVRNGRPHSRLPGH